MLSQWSLPNKPQSLNAIDTSSILFLVVSTPNKGLKLTTPRPRATCSTDKASQAPVFSPFYKETKEQGGWSCPKVTQAVSAEPGQELLCSCVTSVLHMATVDTVAASQGLL